MSKKLDHRFWAKYFKVYDVLNMVIPYQELLGSIINELDIKKGDLVLDAGCGTGNLAVKMKTKGAKVIGIDNCIEALDIYKEKDKQAEILVHDLTMPLPFPDGFFDKIASNNVLYTISKANRQAVYKELKRVLKPGGLLVVANIQKDFKPLNIYKDHLKQDLSVNGYFRLMIKIVKMSFPTIKMFYYNSIIKSNNKSGFYNFIEKGEEAKDLEGHGFKILSELPVYSQQAFLTTSKKNV
ncbi:MAG: methyltransferase domain-containing protein [bacterium]